MSATAVSALGRGLGVNVLAEAVADKDDRARRAALDRLARRGVRRV
ncbi:MAG: hypothetical protein JO347_05150 [Candidatus Eremiobacteraeota bacterium]|nr:hypothetical protein [Candidatus Eremiobacteraeota bacterium]